MHTPNRRRALAVLCGLLIATAASAVTLKENFDKTIPLKPGSELTLRNVNGALTFEAWDRDEVHIQAEKKVRAGTDEAARKMMSQVRIEVTPGSGGLRIETKVPKRNNGVFDWIFNNQVNVDVTYRIHLPRRAAVDAETVNGAVTLAGTRGKVKVETTNGALDVKDVEGDVEAGTTNGAITASRITGAVKASTTNGGVDIVMASLSGNVELDTTNGGIRLQLPTDTKATLDARCTNGGISVADLEVDGERSRRRVTGNINGGGPRISVETVNGGVRISSSGERDRESGR